MIDHQVPNECPFTFSEDSLPDDSDCFVSTKDELADVESGAILEGSTITNEALDRNNTDLGEDSILDDKNSVEAFQIVLKGESTHLVVEMALKTLIDDLRATISDEEVVQNIIDNLTNLFFMEYPDARRNIMKILKI